MPRNYLRDKFILVAFFISRKMIDTLLARGSRAICRI